MQIFYYFLHFFYWKLNFSSAVYEQGTSTEWNNFDSVASYHGLGKMTVVKKRKGG